MANIKRHSRGPLSFLRVGFISVVICARPAMALVPPPPPQMPTDISLDLALKGARAAMAECNKINEKVTVAVVDSAAHVRVVLVSDNYDRDLLGYVQGLAHTVLKTGMSSGDYGKSFNMDLGKISATVTADRLQQVASGQVPIILQLSAGAVPILKNGKIVGVVSVAGSRGFMPEVNHYEDFGPVEPCATAGRNVIETGIKSGL